MHKLNKNMLLILATTTLASCGGSGSGDEMGGSVSYAGKTAPISLTESVYTDMTGDVNTTSTNTNKLSGIIENSQKNIKSVVSKSRLLNRQVQNQSGNCGGSYTVNISQQLSSIVLDNYCNSESGFKMEGNGSVSMTGSFGDEGFSGVGSVVAEEFNVSVIEDGKKSTLEVDGKITYNISTTSSFIKTKLFILKSNESEVGDIKLENFELSSSENASVFTAELDGKIYLGEYGSLTFETTVPFKVSQSATNPTQGTLLIKGNNSTVKLEAVASGDELCSASLDKNGDGAFETTLSSCGLDGLFDSLSASK